LRWEVAASVLVGVAIAAGIVLWPRLVLISLGLVSLLLGLGAAVTLRLANIPVVMAILGGVGLIGFGVLAGMVEALLKEARRAPHLDGSRNGPLGHAEPSLPQGAEVRRDRVEPRL
jgi:hypothetical protein